MNNSTTSTSNPHNQQSQKRDDHSILIHCDGAGCRPDGTGSGFAWIQPQTGKRHVERVDGLTNNQAEYRGLISALNSLADRSTAQIFTDSLLMCSQVNGNYKTRDIELTELLQQVHELIKKKNLKSELRWIPRQENLAGKLL